MRCRIASIAACCAAAIDVIEYPATRGSRCWLLDPATYIIYIDSFQLEIQQRYE
jgi:hypothetical protein